jgi:adenosine deaminase
MKANLILSVDRRNDPDTAMQVVDLALAHQVVGVDLCGDPAVGDVSIFAPAFRKARENDLKITLHFAEAPQSSTPEELWTLLSYKPDRIGHVINVPEEVKEEIVKRKLGLELCLSCNVHAKMITGSFGDHHFGWWRGTGCPIALSVCFPRNALKLQIVLTKGRLMMSASSEAVSVMSTLSLLSISG